MSRRLANLNPYELHKHLINEYILTKPGATKLLQRDTSRDKTDRDVLREHHRFLWDGETVDSWEKQLAKKYYDKLFREYCIADLSRYKENKVAMRWRIEKEVLLGKGQFICGGRSCEERDGLRSWEVNFAYLEHGTKKNALVKLRLCPSCSDKLNYHSKKREIKRLKKRVRKEKHFGRRKDGEPNVDLPGRDIPISTEELQDDREIVEDQSSIEAIAPREDEVQSSSSAAPDSCWTKVPEVEEKSREDEFDEYLEDLLL
ncbi:protein FRA10AC1 [Ochlerotatus camptorhynchus]|uniref:protein FRA10AC1 n=1 Tax=Ochlerotatus camptorhynchus TaxID=644619 RepID=UPI0031D19BAB